MKIHFTETEQPEEDFFQAALAEHDLRFRAGPGEVEADAEILCIYLTSRIDAAFLDSHPKLKLVTTRSAGHDHIDVSECSRRGVIVCEVPGSNANTVAEHTFALMLALSRRIIEAREVKKKTRFSFEWRRGLELENKTTDQIIEDLHNAATQEEAGTRTPEGINQIERLFRNERLLSRPNVVFTPHVAFNSVPKTVENIRAFLVGKPINVVTRRTGALRTSQARRGAHKKTEIEALSEVTVGRA